ncbi:MAG: hypothetical protein ACWGPS_04720 [Candidatus Promineifilaceae bacterium]
MTRAPLDDRQPGRPRSVTIAALGFVLIGSANAWRAAGLFRQSELLLSLGVDLDPRLRLVLSLLWAVVLLGTGAAIWMGRPVVRLLAPVLLLIYAVYNLAILWLFAQADVARREQLVAGLFYLATFLFVTWALNRGAARSYFYRVKE